MKNLDEIKNETAESLGYYSWYEFEKGLYGTSLSPFEINQFIEAYATARVKEVENYYKTQEDDE